MRTYGGAAIPISQKCGLAEMKIRMIVVPWDFSYVRSLAIGQLSILKRPVQLDGSMIAKLSEFLALLGDQATHRYKSYCFDSDSLAQANHGSWKFVSYHNLEAILLS